MLVSQVPGVPRLEVVSRGRGRGRPSRQSHTSTTFSSFTSLPHAPHTLSHLQMPANTSPMTHDTNLHHHTNVRQSTSTSTATATATSKTTTMNARVVWRQRALTVGAVAEAAFCLCEFLLVTLFSTMVSMLLRTYLPLESLVPWRIEIVAPYEVSFARVPHILGTLLAITAWMWLRYRYNLVFPCRFTSVVRPLSRVLMFVVGLQGIEFVVYLWYQWISNEWRFTTANFVAPGDGTDVATVLDAALVVQVVLFMPLLEELTFRGFCFGILYKRLSKQRNGAAVCAIVTSVLFGLFHLVNLVSSRFSAPYIVMQVFLGTEIGLFYTLFMLYTNNLAGSIVLHVFNNLFSSLMPPTPDLHTLLFDPLSAFLFVSSTTTYAVLCFVLWHRIQWQSLRTDSD